MSKTGVSSIPNFKFETNAINTQDSIINEAKHIYQHQREKLPEYLNSISDEFAIKAIQITTKEIELQRVTNK